MTLFWTAPGAFFPCGYGIYGVGELAQKVADVSKKAFGLQVKVELIEDPRMEMQEHSRLQEISRVPN